MPDFLRALSTKYAQTQESRTSLDNARGPVRRTCIQKYEIISSFNPHTVFKCLSSRCLWAK